MRLPGMLRLDEVKNWIGREWEGDMDTVGGFILEVLDRVPEAGEIVEIGDVRVEISEVSHNAVRWILVTIPEVPTAPDENS